MSAKLCGFLPAPNDNAAIVAAEVEPGETIRVSSGAEVTARHRVPVGHRLVTAPIPVGAPVLSWGLPFGRAMTDLVPGHYVCTERSLSALQGRGVSDLPDSPTVVDEAWRRYGIADGFTVGEQVTPVERPGSFAGFRRADGRYGTRNHIAVIGLTAAEGSFVTEVARRSQHLVAPAGTDGLDGVVPVAHTEGAGSEPANNLDFVLRTLHGFGTHPNLGAVLVVERPGSSITAEILQRYAVEHGLAQVRVPYVVLAREHSFDTDAARAVELITNLADGLRTTERVSAPLSALSIALQCGGSDAFSGVTANPLSGAVARELVRHGGTAMLAETDELIGSEGYVLSNVVDEATARHFLSVVDTFAERVGWHGHSAEGNPSGGNLLRGLHNIVLKSLGAARKKDPALRLDQVLDYAEPLQGKGFAFMDSPGNDLESVAGQVASGCNLIHFTTGNGSITNFPFVPTMKFVTTTERFDLLRRDMDVNAGRLLDGEDFDALTAEVFDQSAAVASGQLTAGERAGHSQVSIWRDWRQTGSTVQPAGGHPLRLERAAGSGEDLADEPLPGRPVALSQSDGAPLPTFQLPALRRVVGVDRTGSETLALLLPTSICSGQVAVRMADRASRENWHGGHADRVVALPHTEGCGASSGDSEQIYTRIMINYLQHPNTGWAMLLEHGCEKTHNDHFRHLLDGAGIDTGSLGFASIQGDGGIEAVIDRVHDWFDDEIADRPVTPRRAGDWFGVVVGMCAKGGGEVPGQVADAVAAVTRRLVAAGGSVVLVADDPLLDTAAFATLVGRGAEPTLAHGQRVTEHGLHLMRPAGSGRLETLTALGACGAEVICAYGPGPGQRFVPVLRVAAESAGEVDRGAAEIADADLVLAGGDGRGGGELAQALAEVLAGEREVTARRTHDEGFQITRGLLGVSL